MVLIAKIMNCVGYKRRGSLRSFGVRPGRLCDVDCDATGRSGGRSGVALRFADHCESDASLAYRGHGSGPVPKKTQHARSIGADDATHFVMTFRFAPRAVVARRSAIRFFAAAMDAFLAAALHSAAIMFLAAVLPPSLPQAYAHGENGNIKGRSGSARLKRGFRVAAGARTSRR
jgi:hypothetical protein